MRCSEPGHRVTVAIVASPRAGSLSLVVSTDRIMIPEGAPSRPTEEFVASNIRFVGEQDGPPERTLKTHLVELFSTEPALVRAYLARVQYGAEPGSEVALCL